MTILLNKRNRIHNYFKSLNLNNCTQIFSGMISLFKSSKGSQVREFIGSNFVKLQE